MAGTATVDAGTDQDALAGKIGSAAGRLAERESDAPGQAAPLDCERDYDGVIQCDDPETGEPRLMGYWLPPGVTLENWDEAVAGGRLAERESPAANGETP